MEELDQSPRTQVLSEIQENPSVLKQILIAGGTTLTILGAVGIFLMNALEKLVTAANAAFDAFSTLIKWGIVAIGIFVAIISFIIGIFF